MQVFWGEEKLCSNDKTRGTAWTQKKKYLKVHFLEEPLWTVWGETALIKIGILPRRDLFVSL